MIGARLGIVQTVFQLRMNVAAKGYNYHDEQYFMMGNTFELVTNSPREHKHLRLFQYS